MNSLFPMEIILPGQIFIVLLCLVFSGPASSDDLYDDIHIAGTYLSLGQGYDWDLIQTERGHTLYFGQNEWGLRVLNVLRVDSKQQGAMDADINDLLNSIDHKASISQSKGLCYLEEANTIRCYIKLGKQKREFTPFRLLRLQRDRFYYEVNLNDFGDLKQFTLTQLAQLKLILSIWNYIRSFVKDDKIPDETARFESTIKVIDDILAR